MWPHQGGDRLREFDDDPDRVNVLPDDPDGYLAQFQLTEAESRMVRTMDIKAMDDYVLQTAGNGALEYRNWLVAIGAVKECELDLFS